MSLMLSLTQDPNPLDPPLKTTGTAPHRLLFVQEPPLNMSNPLSVAQHNGFVEGAVQGSVRGLVVGAFLGFLAYHLYRRYA